LITDFENTKLKRLLLLLEPTWVTPLN